MAEFAADDAICVFERIDQERLKEGKLVDAAQGIAPEAWSLSELLPEAFGPKDGF